MRIDLPALFLSGRFDPVTPVRQARIAAAGWPNATVVELPSATHGATEHDACARGLMAAFLDAPAAALDVGCAAVPSDLDFVAE